ncbi:MAG TPA: hypothetical protein PLS41_09340, partial [Bacteroidales bacterium]|nr:hypothetical protein [Bacteroidales bacterium]HPE87514.1 hypothetical protein [Bacteroidales bacterium]
RKNQMKSNYDNGLINDAIYRQEVAFTEFLEKFSYLNKNLESYTLALQMGNPMYISQTLFDIITNYREMLSLKQNREVEFNGLSAYDNIFKPEYESILRNAGVYMEKDRNLKSCRTIAENLYRMNSDETYFLDGDLRENFLSAFYAIDLPDEAYMQASVVGKEIQAQINIMENKHFRAVFLPQIHRLKNMELNDSALHYRNHLLESINHSNCKVCKNKALEEIRAFDERYKAGQIAFEMATKDSLVKAANSVLFALFKKEECLSKNLETYNADPPIWYSMIKEQHNQLKAQLSLLEVVLSASGDITASHPKDITDYNTHVQRLANELKHGYSDICNKLDSLCRCHEEE